MQEPLQRYKKHINIALIVVSILSLTFLLLSFVGYGHFEYPKSANQRLFINGREVRSDSIKLRPGTYDIVLKSARYARVHETVRINPFQTKTYEPELTARDPDEIIGSAIGSFGLYGPPILSQSQYFESNTWIAGIVGPGSPARAALEFTDGRWQVRFFESAGYPKDLSKVPAAVAAYLSGLSQQGSPQ